MDLEGIHPPALLFWADYAYLESGGTDFHMEMRDGDHYGLSGPPALAPIGWVRSHAENQFAFLKAVSEHREPFPGITDGLRTQLVIDAVERSAAQAGAWTPADWE